MAVNVGSITVSLDRAHLSARFKRGDESAGKALAEQVIADSKSFTPHAEGTLEGTGKPEKIDGDWCATWNTVYAAYQWYGCRPDGSRVIHNHTTVPNANATTQWAEAAKAKYGKQWGIVAQNEHAKGGRNLV